MSLTFCAEAVREIGKAYVRQMAVPFYPRDVSRERLEQEAQINPEIFSPYTFVEGDRESLKTAPFHEHPDIRPHLEVASNHLHQAANVTPDPDFAAHLRLRAQSLLDGSYERSEAYWLRMREPVIDIVIGPYDRYKDQRFSVKYAYSGWTGSLDRIETERQQRIVDALLEAYLSVGITGSPFEKPMVRIRVDQTEVAAGLPAEMEMTANSLSCQMEWREKYGTKIVVLQPAFTEKFHLQKLPQVRRIIIPSIRGHLSDNMLLATNAYLFDSHETAHALIRRPNDERRLGNEYTFISELSASVTGMALLPRVGLNNMQLEGVLAVQLATAANEFASSEAGDKERDVYLQGDAVLLNYLLRRDAVSIDDSGRIGWKNIRETYTAMLTLAKELEEITTSGNINSARRLKRELGAYESLKSLLPFKDNPQNPPSNLPVNSGKNT